MKRWLKQIWQPGAARYSALEYAVMRLAFAWVLLGSFKLAGYHAFDWFGSPGRGASFRPDYPRSIAQFVDVTWIIDPAWIPWFSALVCIGLIFFVLGTTPLLSSGLLLFLQTHIGALEISANRKVDHVSQILCFVLLGVFLAALYDAVQTLRSEGIAGWRRLQAQRWKWLGHLFKFPAAWVRPAATPVEFALEASRSRAIYTVQQLVATAYVVSAISKLWRSKGRWIAESKNIHLQFIKNQRNEYHETLNPTVHTPWAVEFVSNHPLLAQICLGLGLCLELFCLLALANRAALAIFGIGLILMHLMIAEIMVLYFDFNIWTLTIWYVNLPFWLLLAWRRKNGDPGLIPGAEVAN